MTLSLEVKVVRTPFRQVFSHSSAERSAAESVFVRLADSNGIEGFGEACPRSYVTGESAESCLTFLQNLAKEADSFATLSALQRRASSAIASGNAAAWCAFELAWLDYSSRRERKSLETFLGLPNLAPPFSYTAVIGIQSLSAFEHSIEAYKALEISDFKVKVSGDIKEDNLRLAALKEIIGAELRVRLDANNCFASKDEALSYLDSLDTTPFAIEEPLKNADLGSLAEIARRSNLRIILDESLTNISIMEALSRSATLWMCNLRVSKLGGILSSLAVAEAASKAKIPIIMGCHVGESSLLTRGALAVSNAFRENLIAREGAFGTYLLERDVTDEPLMFGKRGLLSDTAALHAPGLGIKVKIF